MSQALATPGINLRSYHLPKTVIGRFVARRTIRGAVLWGLVFGVYVASKAIGFVDLYPTAAARQKIAESFSNNLGIELLIGRAPHSATTAAYVAWNTASLMVIIGSIWALLLATKYFRGEEDAGRAEVLLAGQTTARRAALNILLGLGASLLALFVIIFLLFTAVGRSHGVDFGTGAASYFAFVVAIGISLFLLLGALASQLMSTRSRAAGLSAVVLGIFVLMRAIGDVTSAHWLLNLTPMGWLENAQPLSREHPLWLVPFAVLLLVIVGLVIYFAGKRDLGESIISDKTETRSHYGLVHSPLGLTIRLTRAASMGWLAAIFITALIYGLISKSTGQIFSQSKSFEKTFSHLAQSARVSGVLTFLGIVFFIQMILIMALTAPSIAAMRREEATGYLDNFLVRPYSRFKWLVSRLSITALVVVLAGLLTTLGIWLGIVSQHTGISLHTLLLASLNAIVPAALVIGVGVLAYGVVPRLTSAFSYSVLAWSVLIELLGTGLNLNHWLLDTSLLHQVVLAPSVATNWSVDLIVTIIAVILACLGALCFNARDLEGE
jgi:ABC-2 type transport system permease protein